MKKYLLGTLLMAGTLWTACATGKSGPMLDAVGPSWAPSTAAVSTNGTLTVFSAYDATAGLTSRDPNRPEYSDYKILTADGKLLRRVHNNSGTILQDAVVVDLPPGRYQVTAQANGYGRVTIPIVIQAGQQTVLHLEGGGSWPDESAFNQTNAVRLPDGRIIGWKAADNGQKN